MPETPQRTREVFSQARDIYNALSQAGFDRDTIESLARCVKNEIVWEKMPNILKIPFIRMALSLRGEQKTDEGVVREVVTDVNEKVTLTPDEVIPPVK